MNMTTSKNTHLSKFNFEVALLVSLIFVSLTTLQRCDAAQKMSQQATSLNVTAVTGVAVELKCKVRLQDCGNFFSIDWYRDATVNVVQDNNVNVGHDTDEDDDDGVESRRQLSSNARGKRDAEHGGRRVRQTSSDSPETYDPVPTIESERVYVYRHHSGLAKSEGSWEGRAEHQYDAKRHIMTIRYIKEIVFI